MMDIQIPTFNGSEHEPMRLLLNLLRITGILEGISYLALLLIAMPLKYLFDKPEAVMVTGSLHGGLFIAYIALAFAATLLFKWPFLVFIQSFVASLVPGGTFWMDRKFASLEPVRP